jgi:hypothetical protein
MHQGYHPFDDVDNLKLLDITEAGQFPDVLKGCASTIDLSTGLLNEDCNAKGEKILTFNGILKYDMFPLAAIVRDILELGQKAMNTPIEIEFAVNLNRKLPKKPEFSLLQIRPIAEGMEESDVRIDESEQTDALVYSEMVMGNGKISEIKDAIVIKYDQFNPKEMAGMATEIEKFNTEAESTGQDFLLIVAGRLGSCDPWLGIPVVWAQISHARVIVETGFPDFQVEPSQGTHFFQNLTLLGNCYMTVNPSFNQGKLNLDGFSKLEKVEESSHFIHYRNTQSFDIRIDGLERRGIITVH